MTKSRFPLYPAGAKPRAPIGPNLYNNDLREEIHASTYRDFEDLRKRMEEFIEGYYNVCRLHSALDYRSPEDFEKECKGHH